MMHISFPKRVFVRCIVEGDDPVFAARCAYPKCKDPQRRAATLLYQENVKECIQFLLSIRNSPEIMQIQATKILNNPKESAAAKAAALKVLTQRSKEDEKKKSVPDDEQFLEKIRSLNEKAELPIN